MTLARALQVAAGNSQETGDVAEAIDFDGTNDLLSRSTDLVGNTDGQSFTLSFWLWRKNISGLSAVYTAEASAGTTRFSAYVAGNTTTVEGYDSGGTLRLSVSFNLGVYQYTETFYHVLVSVNKTSTATRSVYVNDVLQSATWDTYSTANNIDFTTPIHSVMGLYGTTAAAAGRLSNLFLDKTYRDLSNVTNRRLFITADLKPADGQAALNPILYLPLSDPTAPGVNAGTGGDFTLTGTVARSGRGPNQYNAPYSDLDGTADYLSRTTAPTGIADGKQFTVQWCGSLDAGLNRVISIGSSTTERFFITMNGGSGRLQFIGRDAAGVERLNAISPTSTIVFGRNYVITISVDLNNTANRHVYINGSAVSMTWTTYSSAADIDFQVTSAPRYRVGYSAADSNFFNGRLGAVWFNTSYIDLSVADNLAKFVTGTGIDAKPVDLGANGELPTGTAPIIYLPMYGNNAGKNYGTGGDFTVNSGPFTGARGPNEFWGNVANFAASSGELSSSSVLNADGKTFSFSFFIKVTDNTCNVLRFDPSSGSAFFHIVAFLNKVAIQVKNVSNVTILYTDTGASSIAYGTWYHVCGMVDLSNTSNRGVFINNVSKASAWSNYVNENIPFSAFSLNHIHGEVANPSSDNSFMSELYFTTEYIDFTQEANRLKFRDAFGNPVDLTQQIEDAAIPNPAIYMRFPPTAFGTNYGTGGNFTVNGTITDGGQL